MILKTKTLNYSGFTLIEMIIGMAVMIIVAAAIGGIIVDNQRSWSVLYAQVNSDIVTDGFVARKKFDTVMRSASGSQIDIADNGQSIEVNYYASDASTSIDRYGKFFIYNNTLYYEYGKLEPKEKIATETICSNVTKCTFKKEGISVQMILTLDNGEMKKNIVT